MTLISIFIALLFLYSLFSGWIERSIITAPIVFTSAGMLIYWGSHGVLAAGLKLNILLHIAEMGLVFLLFTDASRTDLKVLRSIYNLPTRLLSGGMLLTLLLGILAARLVFPQITWWEAGILSAILAPTDAGLGQIIVNSPQVPMRIRQALNIEAGLNDGLSVPFLLFFIALAGASSEGTEASLMQFIIEQLGYGVLVGAGVGLAGGWLLGFAKRRELIAQSYMVIGVVLLPVFCMLLSEAVGASMFIAAFVSGLAVQIRFKEAGEHSVEFAEEWGQLLNLSVFFLFGLYVARSWSEFTIASVFYALLSLSVVRMLPVSVALTGTRLSRASVLFMGWFGPRGLASIVLGLVYLEKELHLPDESTIRIAVMVTVLLSIFAHGLSAAPGISLYKRKISNLDPSAPEHTPPCLQKTEQP